MQDIIDIHVCVITSPICIVKSVLTLQKPAFETYRMEFSQERAGGLTD